eukprot:CFRG3619T1
MMVITKTIVALALAMGVQGAARLSTARSRGAELLNVVSSVTKMEVTKMEVTKMEVAPKIKVELYAESMCPFCSNFIQGSLANAWQASGVFDIMDIDVIMYGNAHEIPNPTVHDKFGYQCQHGPKECEGNIVMACAIHVLDDVQQWFPYILCLEKLRPTDPGSAESECEDFLFVTQSKIKALHDCVSGDLGKSIIHKNAERTANLDPPHKYVPWIVINGQHNEAIQTAAQHDLAGFVCEMYTGTKPDGCPTNHSFRDEADL